MNVCEALLDILANYNVRYIFGIPGDAINDLIEAIRRQDKIKFIHVMHEESGAFAASAQAKLSGELAVCAGTAGPGGIHLLNGLYDAKLDHAPVLAITGQVETSMIGTAYHQEVNLQSLFENVAVYNQTVIDPAQMPVVATLAIQSALSKKGVAHISIPSNISSLKVPDYKKQKQVIHDHVTIRPCEGDMNKAAALLNHASQPCILAGIGARNAVPELLQLAELLHAPIIKALRGKDILPDTHPQTMGGIGYLGTEPAVNAMKNCDLLLMVGSDFPYHDFYPGENVQFIQIDRETDQIGRRHRVDVPLTGDAKTTLTDLLPMITQKTNDNYLKGLQDHMQEWRAKQDKIELSDDIPIHPQALTRAISDQADDDAIIICDTGTVTVWGARNFSLKGTQRFTLSGGLASMAYGLPGAIGAKLLYPGRQVIALCGDGGFAMLMCDLATAVKYKLDIKIFVYNNSKLGLIQIEQNASGNPEFETDLHNPDYEEFARCCGAEGFTIKDAADLIPTVSKALTGKNPCVINVMVNPYELTWPPEVTMEQAMNYSTAKIKEFFNE